MSDMDAVMKSKPEVEVVPLKELGVYTLTVEPSINFLTIGAEKPVLVYCVTNTVTKVRESEDSIFASAHNALVGLSQEWDSVMDTSLIAVQDKKLVIPTHSTPKSIH